MNIDKILPRLVSSVYSGFSSFLTVWSGTMNIDEILPILVSSVHSGFSSFLTVWSGTVNNEHR